VPLDMSVLSAKTRVLHRDTVVSVANDATVAKVIVIQSVVTANAIQVTQEETAKKHADLVTGDRAVRTVVIVRTENLVIQ